MAEQKIGQPNIPEYFFDSYWQDSEVVEVGLQPDVKRLNLGRRRQDGAKRLLRQYIPLITTGQIKGETLNANYTFFIENMAPGTIVRYDIEQLAERSSGDFPSGEVKTVQDSSVLDDDRLNSELFIPFKQYFQVVASFDPNRTTRRTYVRRAWMGIVADIGDHKRLITTPYVDLGEPLEKEEIKTGIEFIGWRPFKVGSTYVFSTKSPRTQSFERALGVELYHQPVEAWQAAIQQKRSLVQKLGDLASPTTQV